MSDSFLYIQEVCRTFSIICRSAILLQSPTRHDIQFDKFSFCVSNQNLYFGWWKSNTSRYDKFLFQIHSAQRNKFSMTLYNLLFL